MSGKGSCPRPFSVSADEYADRFDAIFGKKQMGHSSTGRAAGSNPAAPSACAGSTPAAPAIYINPETNEQVTEDWWPTIKEPTA